MRFLRLWRRWYLCNYADPHPGLRTMSVAAAYLQDVAVMRVPMPIPGRGSRRAAWRFLWKLFAHLLIVVRVFRSSASTIIVREFLTLPVVVIAPLLWPFRRRLWFLNNHNLAKANSSTTHAKALRLLARMGFQFLVFEDASLWTQVLGQQTKSAIRTAPFPAPIWPAPDRLSSSSAPVVGLIGNFRPEKSPVWALEIAIRLASDTRRPFQLLVGSNEPAFLQCWQGRGAIAVDTTRYSDYKAALARCDVVVLPYDVGMYFGRASGVTAEAIASGCAVVVPNLPVLRSQTSHPTLAGVTFSGQESFAAAILGALGLSSTGNFRSVAAQHAVTRGVPGFVSFFQSLR